MMAMCTGRGHGASGIGNGSRAELAATFELYRAMEMTFWLPLAKASLRRGE
jgi:hypothetical protein